MDIRSAIEKYINGPLRTSLGFSDRYGVRYTPGDNKIVLLGSRDPKDTRLTDFIKNERIKSQIEKTIASALSSVHVVDSEIINIEKDTIWILLYCNMSQAEKEYMKTLELLEHYYYSDENKFEELFKTANLEESDKVRFVSPRKLGISELIINSGVSNDNIFSEHVDKYDILWNGERIYENFFKLLLENSDNVSDDALFIYSHNNSGSNPDIEKYLPDDPTKTSISNYISFYCYPSI